MVGKGMQGEGFDACSIPLVVGTTANTTVSSQDDGIIFGLRTWDGSILLCE